MHIAHCKLKMKTTVNILGCCVSRDLFGLFKGNGGFDIKQCVTNISPLSVCSPKLFENDVCTESDFPNSNHYAQRCTCLDINKSVFDYLAQFNADYTLIDLGILFSIYTLKIKLPDGNFTYITYKDGLKQNPDFLENAPFEIVEKFRFPDNKDLFFQCIRQYAQLISEHIDQNKIIILEFPLTQRYIDDNGIIQYFSAEKYTENMSKYASRSFDTSAISKYLKKAYRMFEAYFPKAHIIKCPDTEVLCNQNYKWGLHPLHYVIEFYQYALNAIRVISFTDDRKNEKIMLDSLRDTFTDLLMSKYSSVFGEYSLENLSVISSDTIRFGKHITLCFHGGGGTNSYTFQALVKRKNEVIWKNLGEFDGGLVKYKPVFCGAYEACIKLKDTNNVEVKKFFDFTVI